MKGSIVGTFAILVIVILAVLVVLLVITNLASQSYSPSLPSMPSTNGQVPSSIPEVANQSGYETSLQVAALSQRSLDNQTNLTITYNGTLYLKPSGLVGVVTTINSPLHLKEEKSGKELKLAANATALPIIGAGYLYFLSLSNGTYTCSNFNASALAAHNYGKLLLNNGNVSCARGSTLVGINLTQIATFNLSAFGKEGLQLNYTKRYQSSYNDMPCTVLSGIITQPNSTNASIGNGVFQLCLSDRYYLPLTFYMYFKNNQVAGSISLNETSLGNQSSKAYVESIPGHAG